MVERTPIQSQERFGPAQSRARVFSVFAPVRPNEDAGKAAKDISEILGATAEYASQQELEQAQQERDEGLRDYVSGLVQDGQRIVNGEMQPIESRYYMAGVEMGMGRTKGRRVWQSFTEWQADNPRPGLDSDMSYEEWLEAGLAFAQEEAGVDPDNMSVAMSNEYAGIINQIRQRDNEQLIAQLNREADAASVEAFNSDVTNLQLEFNPEDLGSTYASAENLMARARANPSIDLDAARRQILTSFTNIARQSGDVSVLQNIPQGVLRSANINAQLLDVIPAVEAEIRANQLSGQTEILRQVQELYQDEDIDAAQALLDESEAAGRISGEAAMSMDATLDARRRAMLDQARSANDRRAQRDARNSAISMAVTARTVGQGATWQDPVTGEVESISSEELVNIISYDALERNGGVPGPQYFGELARLSEEHGVRVPALESRLRQVLDFSTLTAIETGELTQGQTLALQALMEINPDIIPMHVSDPDEAAILTTTRFMYDQTGGNRIEDLNERSARLGESLARASRVVNAPAVREGGLFSRDPSNALRSFLVDTTDDGSQNFEFNFAIPSNLDGDNNRLVDAWANRHTDIAVAIQQTEGEEAARAYLENVANSTMIVNRQPVSAIGSINARPDQYGERVGQIFLQRLANQVAADVIVPEIGMAYEQNLINDITGWTGEFNPLDPDAMAALGGAVETYNVPNGLVFEFEESRVFVRTNELNAMYEAFLRDRESTRGEVLSAAEQEALQRSNMNGLAGQSQQLFLDYMGNLARVQGEMAAN